MAPQPAETSVAPAADDYDFEGTSPLTTEPAPNREDPPVPASASRVAINAAGKPYDPATGKLLSADAAATLETITPQPATGNAKLIARARDAGVGEDIISSVTPEQLNEITHSFREQQLQTAKQMADYRKAVASDFVAAKGRKPGLEAGQDATRGHDVLPPSDAPEVDWGEYEEEVEGGVKVKKPFKDVVHENFRKVVESQAKQIKRLEGIVHGLMQNEAFRQNLSNKQIAVMELSKFPDLFGSGDLDELDADGPEAVKVRAIRDFMAAIPKEKRTTFSKDLAKGAKLLFGADPKGAAPAPPSATADSTLSEVADPRWRQGLTRPTQRAGASEPPGREKAERGVREFQRANAEANGQSEDFDDGL